MTDVYGTKVKLTKLTDDDDRKFTSNPVWDVALNGESIGLIAKNPVGWYVRYPDGDFTDYYPTRTEMLNKLIAYAQYLKQHAA